MRVVTKTELVEVPVEVYRPLPANLVQPTPYPPALPDKFVEGDKTDLIFALYDALDQANRDKARAGELTQPRSTEAPADVQ